jgi:hypothetical protein
MTDESIHNNPRDPAEERFEQLEEQVVDINYNMKLFMESNLRPLRDDGGSNS